MFIVSGVIGTSNKISQNVYALTSDILDLSATDKRIQRFHITTFNIVKFNNANAIQSHPTSFTVIQYTSPWWSNVCYMYLPVKLKLQHPPPGMPRAFDCALCPGRGKFERCPGRVGKLNWIYLLFWRNIPVCFFGFCKV